MPHHFDVIVIGVGAMGASACWHLARRGRRVLGIEQFGIPHTLGSSHGQTRMIRLAYYEHPDYVPLLRRAYELWDELERTSGQKILHRTGGLYMGGPGDELVTGSLRSARQHGLPHEALDRAEITRRFPQFTLPDDFSGMFEPDAGFLLCERVVATYVTEALRLGAHIRAHEPVLSWQSGSGGVTVRTDHGTYHAGQLILTAGPWTGRLIPDLGINLRVTRQVMGWVWPKQPQHFTPGRIGVWAIGHPDGSLHYGFPLLAPSPPEPVKDLPGEGWGEGLGMKIAFHRPADIVDPDTVDRTPRPEDEQTFRPILQRHLPAADGPLLSMRICLYTNSPDHHFILDQHPRYPNIHLACGFSGHGFKFASVIGQILADYATEGATDLPAGFLRADRFAPCETTNP
jgi:sarcosine oxidase